MDCLCCADGGIGPPSDKEFLGSICNLYTANGTPAKFPVEKDRYILYVAAGCPFAARPWLIQAIYGLPVQIVKVYPATHTDGWFFEPQSEGEQLLVESFPTASVDKDPYGSHHLSQLYEVANPNFEGVVSVPVLWDKVNNTIVSNSSLGLAEMLATQLKPHLATRNQHLDLYPDPVSEESLAKDHSELIKWIHSNITSAVYKIAQARPGKQHDEMIHIYYKALSDMEKQLISNDQAPRKKNSLAYLTGEKIRFADVLLWISLLRLDICYQFRFGLGKFSIREGKQVDNSFSVFGTLWFIDVSIHSLFHFSIVIPAHNLIFGSHDSST
jgi:putative glutathione S-transferase